MGGQQQWSGVPLDDGAWTQPAPEYSPGTWERVSSNLNSYWLALDKPRWVRWLWRWYRGLGRN